MPAWCCSATFCHRSTKSRPAVGRLASIPVSGHLLQVLDPAEADLPYAGRIRFRGLEREGDTLIPRVEGVRDEYGRRMKAQQDGLAAICAAAGFSFAIHRTDHSPEAALLGLYTALPRDEGGTSPARSPAQGRRHVTVESWAAARNDP